MTHGIVRAAGLVLVAGLGACGQATRLAEGMTDVVSAARGTAAARR